MLISSHKLRDRYCQQFLSMKVIHAHIDVRMISLAIGVNSLSLPVMRKIVEKIFDYFSYIYKFLCWFYWKTLEEIGIQWCFCCGLVFQGEFMVVPSLCERSGNWKHLLTSSPSCGERGGKGWLKLHGWEPSGNYFISGCVQLYSIPHILLQSCVFQLKTMKGWQVLVYF